VVGLFLQQHEGGFDPVAGADQDVGQRDQQDRDADDVLERIVERHQGEADGGVTGHRDRQHRSRRGAPEVLAALGSWLPTERKTITTTLPMHNNGQLNQGIRCGIFAMATDNPTNINEVR
jgi:hypothetical protein